MTFRRSIACAGHLTAPAGGGSETIRWYHHDQLGSTRALTDASGTTIATFSYTPFGELESSTGTAKTPFGWAGEYRDTETGYVYLRARYYDPATAQYLTRDPLEAITGSPYGYVENNPTNAIDPTGMSYCVLTSAGTIVCIAGAVTIGVLAGYTTHQLTLAADGFTGLSCPLPDWGLGGGGGGTQGGLTHHAESALPELPNVDATGKVHGDLPDPDDLAAYDPEDLREFEDALEQSIATRQDAIRRLGTDEGHRNRLQQEQDLLRRVRKILSGS